MSCSTELNKWLSNTTDDEKTQKELKSIINDPEEVESRFGSALAFGTAGLRGVMGAGLNRMNVYTVRQTTQGLANLIVSRGTTAMARGVAIAHDSRHNSRRFALEAACVFAASGIVSYVFDELRPTPELSFAIRELKCIAGVNITASHNPKQYNGYKVYWEDGAQISPHLADTVLGEIRKTDIFSGVGRMPLEKAEAKGLVRFIGSEVDEKYLKNVLEQSLCPDAVRAVADDFKIIYTPFHGAGYKLVPEVLRRTGFKHIIPVAEQMVIDGDFPTVKSPNPEEKEGFNIAIGMAKRMNIDLIIGTDPDSDRAGVVVRRSDGEYICLSGNQIGAMLVDFIISIRREKGILPKNAAVVTTIVSTRIASEICRRNGVAEFETLTGFKFIGEKIKEFEETGDYTFIFGFEESFGYLCGSYARDKDAVLASMLIAQMAAWYKLKGMTLYDALIKVYEKYGWYREKTTSILMQGNDALEHMHELMKRLRAKSPADIDGTAIVAVRDYLSGKRTELATGKTSSTGLPESDVLAYELADGSTIVIRPSGTEPKVKLYLLVKGDDADSAQALIDRYEKAFRAMLS